MKIIAIGDTHGTTYWKKIVNQNKDADKYVFIGDYFDTHKKVSAIEQISNFKDIIEFKKNNINKVKLLVGNHDGHYLRGFNEHYSGYQPLHAIDIQEQLHNALDKDLLQMCYVYKNFLFVHAGITKVWAKSNKINFNNLEQSVNDLFRNKPHSFRFTRGANYDETGDDICQTPIWVRPISLYRNKIDFYTQVVGHTQVKNISLNIKNIVLIDALDECGEYLEINNDKPIIRKITC